MWKTNKSCLSHNITSLEDLYAFLRKSFTRALLLITLMYCTGGSAVASDTIYREVLRLKEAGKPVIVSMGNVAASGGYYISAPATKIVAQPSTVTGSIGVVSHGQWFWGT